LYLAKLFGSGDTQVTVRVITARLVLVLDPLAVLRTLAAPRDNRAWDSGRIWSLPERVKRNHTELHLVSQSCSRIAHG
jgi:hypothetical protein